MLANTNLFKKMTITITDNCYKQSDLIEIPHAMFNRNGGVSKDCFKSLNSSFQVGDNPQSVRKNREIIKKYLHIKTLISAKQIHSAKINSIKGMSKDMEVPACDSLISKQPGIGLLIQQADCQAILIYDPKKKVIAAIHNGWRGSVINIIQKTISKMKKEYGCDPSNFRCIISPSLGPCCSEFINYREELPQEFYHYQPKNKHFDFWKISRNQLLKTGVIDQHIDIIKICTACNDDYFSYRRANKLNLKTTGRNASVIALPSL